MRGRKLVRDIPVDSAPVVRLMPGKFTLAGHPVFTHWTQEPMPQKSNILEGCHSIPRRTSLADALGYEKTQLQPASARDESNYLIPRLRVGLRFELNQQVVTRRVMTNSG